MENKKINYSGKIKNYLERFAIKIAESLFKNFDDDSGQVPIGSNFIRLEQRMKYDILPSHMRKEEICGGYFFSNFYGRFERKK